MADTSMGQIQTDAQGRRYIDSGSMGLPSWAQNKRTYISPAAYGESGPTDQGGVFHTRPEFNQQTGNYDQGPDWGNILSLAVGGVAAAPLVMGALGAGAGAGAASSAGATGATTGAAATGAATGAIPGASLGMSAALPGAVSSVPALAGAGGAMSTAAAVRGGAQLVGGISRQLAKDRSEQLASSMDASGVVDRREAENRAERTSAWRQLQQAEYMMNNKGYQPRAGLPTFGTTGVAPTNAERQGASGMRDEVLKRLMGGKLQDPNYAEMAKPSGWENLAKVAGPALQYGSMFF